jgi:hypothetical protein
MQRNLLLIHRRGSDVERLRHTPPPQYDRHFCDLEVVEALGMGGDWSEVRLRLCEEP